MHLSDTQIRLNSGLRIRCEPMWSLEQKWSDHLPDCDYWLVWAGRGEMQLRDRTVSLHPGVVIWARPGGQYLAHHDPTNPLGVTAIHFDLLTDQAQTMDPDLIPPEAFELTEFTWLDLTLQKIISLADLRLRNRKIPATSPRLKLAESLMKTVLQLTVDRVFAPSPASRIGLDPEQVRNMTDWADRIATAPGDALTVAAMADATGYSPDHFTRLFQQVIGQPPSQFIIQARIARARQLLGETRLSISQIADALGYNDVYFFSKQFKKSTGLSPTHFRRTRA